MNGALAGQEGTNEVLAATCRADADGESGLFRPASLSPTAASETRGLSDPTRLFEGDSAAAHCAGDVTSPVDEKCSVTVLNDKKNLIEMV